MKKLTLEDLIAPLRDAGYSVRDRGMSHEISRDGEVVGELGLAAASYSDPAADIQDEDAASIVRSVAEEARYGGIEDGLRAAVAEGRRYGWTDRLFARPEPGGGYLLVAVQRLPAIYDEDPQSVSCGCGLYGESHGHAERVYEDVDELATAFMAADRETRRQHPPRFADLERVG